MWVLSLSQEDPLEEEMATYAMVHGVTNSWTHTDTDIHTHTNIHMPGRSSGGRNGNLCYGPWGHKELHLHTHTHTIVSMGSQRVGHTHTHTHDCEA